MFGQSFLATQSSLVFWIFQVNLFLHRFIKVQSIYSIVSVSALQHSAPVICILMFFFSCYLSSCSSPRDWTQFLVLYSRTPSPIHSCVRLFGVSHRSLKFLLFFFAFFSLLFFIIFVSVCSCSLIFSLILENICNSWFNFCVFHHLHFAGQVYFC